MTGVEGWAHPPGPRVVALDCEALYVAVDRRRRALRITGREVLRQIGERSPSSLTRLGQGKPPSADLLVRLLHWLGTTDVGPFLVTLDPTTKGGDHGQG